jgi:hypothetical protein
MTGVVRPASRSQEALVCVHPMVLAEIALGSIRHRAQVLALLADLPRAVEADHDEVLGLIDSDRLHGRGIGLVDVHLLASTRLTAATRPWTRDARLRAAADRARVGWRPDAG